MSDLNSKDEPAVGLGRQIELFVHARRNPGFKSAASGVEVPIEFGNPHGLSLWERHESFRSAERSNLWLEPSDLEVPMVADSDEYCPMCSNAEPTPIWTPRRWDACSFCEGCSGGSHYDYTTHQDLFWVGQSRNRPVVLVCRGVPEDVVDEISRAADLAFSSFLSRVDAMYRRKMVPGFVPRCVRAEIKRVVVEVAKILVQPDGTIEEILDVEHEVEWDAGQILEVRDVLAGQPVVQPPARKKTPFSLSPDKAAPSGET